MSRIAKNPIPIPGGVEVKIDGGNIEVKGPKGALSRSFREDFVSVEIKDNEVICVPIRNNKTAASLLGTYASHIKNMIKGVTEGFEKKLEIEGVGYRVKLEGDKMVLSLGFSHPVEVKKPEGIDFQVEKNTIIVSGRDKEMVGQITSDIRALKKPEPYKGKGIRYEGEVIRRKTGKKAASSA